MAKCSECGQPLVACDRHGNITGTGYLVCPVAREEQTRKEFEKPYRRRRHRLAQIQPTPDTRNQQHDHAARLQIPLFANL